MAFQRRKEGFGGGFKGKSTFRGPSHGRSFSDRREGPPTLYPATCADCGVRCEVPFRPNGKKPVLCKDCFGQGGGDMKPKFAPRRESERPAGNDNLASQLRAMNMKLDAIIKLLSSDDLAL